MTMDPIIYEQPLNEHIRVCLRLENLFAQVQHWAQGTNPWDSRSALAAVVEILNVLDRPDLKTRLVKELARYSTQLARYAETPGIDRSKLNSLLHELEQTTHHLHSLQGRVGQGLRDNDFLISIRQHLTNPGGGCSFDAPAYHYWLHQPPAERIVQLTQWLNSLKIMQSAITLTLRLIRQSSAPKWQMANNGFYQASLDANLSCQLVRVIIPRETNVYPEISVGRHGISIRFYNLSLAERPSQINEDIKFLLTCCVF